MSQADRKAPSLDPDDWGDLRAQGHRMLDDMLDNLETLTARSSLAAAHFAAGRRAEVIPLLQRTLADSERYLGADHPLTAAARDNLEAASRN